MKYKAKAHYAADYDMYSSKAFVKACLILQRKARTYHTLLLADLTVIGTGMVTTLATDGFHVYINKDYFLSLPSDEHRAAALYHECDHAAKGHNRRSKHYMARGKGPDGEPYNHELMVCARDFIINADIESVGLPVDDDWLRRDDVDRNDMADAVYIMLKSEMPPPPPEDDEGEDGDEGEGEGDGGSADASSQQGEDNSDLGEEFDLEEMEAEGEQGEGGDSGSNAEGSEGAPEGQADAGHGEHDLMPLYDGTAEEQAAQAAVDGELMEKAVGEAIDLTQEAFEQGDIDTEQKAGAELASCTRNAGLARKQDWRNELSDLLNRAGNGGEANWKRIHRRRFNTLGIVSPTRKGDIQNMVFTIDKSYSVCDDALDAFLIEAAQAIDILRPNNVVILWTSHRVDRVDEITTGAELLQLERPGGGGTYMTAAVEWLETNGIDPDVHLIFTDLEMSDRDVATCHQSGAIFVADHDVNSNIWTQRLLRGSGARVISVSDAA